MNKIISRENSKLKHAKKVRDGKVDRKIFIEGARLTAEVLRSAVQIEEALVSSDFAGSERSARLIDDLSTRGIPLSEMDNRLFQSLADTKNSQGIALICSRPDTSFSAFAAGYRTGAGLAILLNEINNPSNVGAILRTAEAAGVSEIVVSNDSTDVYSPKALRASMGSGLRLNIWENAGFDEAVSWFRENGCVVTAADVGAKRNYTEIDWKVPRLLVMGSEAHGLSSEKLAFIDEQIRIPMESGVESLNLSVSCGIMLYEARRQHGI